MTRLLRSLPCSVAVTLALAVVAQGDVTPPAPAPAPVPAPDPAPNPAPAPATPAAQPKPAVLGRGYVGFTPAPAAALSPKQRTCWGVKATTGVVAVRVLADSPAALAGLRDGDVLLRYLGQDVPSTKDLDVSKPERVQAFLIAFGALGANLHEADVVELVVERDGKPVTLKATAVGMGAIRILSPIVDDEDEDGEDEEPEGRDGPEKGDGKAKEPAKAPEKPVAPEPAPAAPPAPEKPVK